MLLLRSRLLGSDCTATVEGHDKELEDEIEQVAERAQDLNDRAQQAHERAEQLGNRHDQSTPPDPQRAVQAARHEVEALERAISTHKQAARFWQRQGRPDRAGEGRARADHDRDLLARARAELANDEAAVPRTLVLAEQQLGLPFTRVTEDSLDGMAGGPALPQQGQRTRAPLPWGVAKVHR